MGECRFQAFDARLTHDILGAGLPKIFAVEHPVVRGATWAAFAAYHQFYFDGNKRAGRYTMNAVGMSHGFDAILIPASAKSAYENTVVGALLTDDLTAHIRFLLDLYPTQ
jgi:Fic family protein